MERKMREEGKELELGRNGREGEREVGRGHRCCKERGIGDNKE